MEQIFDFPKHEKATLARLSLEEAEDGVVGGEWHSNRNTVVLTFGFAFLLYPSIHTEKVLNSSKWRLPHSVNQTQTPHALFLITLFSPSCFMHPRVAVVIYDAWGGYDLARRLFTVGLPWAKPRFSFFFKNSTLRHAHSHISRWPEPHWGPCVRYSSRLNCVACCAISLHLIKRDGLA